MQSGEISDEQLSTSSERDSNHSATQSRLHVVNPDRGGSWAAKNNNTDQWLQVDLVILHTIVTRVATQGSNGPKREWVTKYILQFGNDTEMFYNYTVPEQNTIKVKLDDHWQGSCKCTASNNCIMLGPLEERLEDWYMNQLEDCFHIVITVIHKVNSYQRFNGKPLMLLIQRFLLETLIRIPWFITT